MVKQSPDITGDLRLKPGNQAINTANNFDSITAQQQHSSVKSMAAQLENQLSNKAPEKPSNSQKSKIPLRNLSNLKISQAAAVSSGGAGSRHSMLMVIPATDTDTGDYLRPSAGRLRSNSQKHSMKIHEKLMADERRGGFDRFSVSALLSLESSSSSSSLGNDASLAVDDELTRGTFRLKSIIKFGNFFNFIRNFIYLFTQKALSQLDELKSKISTQSKRNFLLEKDVRYLDSRIALLIQNRMALDEVSGFRFICLCDSDYLCIISEKVVDIPSDDKDQGSADSLSICMDDRKKQLYGNFFFLLQSEPRLLAQLTRLLSLSEIDTFLQTVMFTLYGNQYDSREEHLLLTMFQSVLKSDFEMATDFGSLLRANTPVSRMMTTYTRRGPGQQFLKFVLHENLLKIIQEPDVNLEIDPLKVYNQMINDEEASTGETSSYNRSVTSEQAAEDPNVQSIIKQRCQSLMQIADGILDTIIDSLEQVPYGIRWICKQIRDLTQEKYPDVSRWAVCSLIGGFFFLRFINPAIVTPESYMIVDQKPQKLPRRTLTLLAKIIQNLANKPSYNKESYMLELKPFIEGKMQKISDFLYSLGNVDDYYECLELDQYMAMSKKDIYINISLNEIFNTHALFEKHYNEVCGKSVELIGTNGYQKLVDASQESFFDSCRHLRGILKDLGGSPAQISRKENRHMNLHLFSRWETAPVLFGASIFDDLDEERLAQTQNPQTNLYTNTKSMLVLLLRKQAYFAQLLNAPAPPIAFKNPPHRDSQVTLDIDQILSECTSSACRIEPSLVRTCIEVRKNLKILEDEQQHPNVKREQNYKQLSKDLLVDFNLLVKSLDKATHELNSLQLVYQTITDHNRYLRSQLNSYKSYLQNVRIQAGSHSNSSRNNSTTMIGVSSPLLEKPSKKSLVFPGKKSKTSANSTDSAAAATMTTRRLRREAPNPIKLSHVFLEKQGVIVHSSVPENR